MRDGLGRVYATGMYRYIGHVKFSKFQTGIFVQWKAPPGKVYIAWKRKILHGVTIHDVNGGHQAYRL